MPDVLPGTARLEDREGYPALTVSQWDAFLIQEMAKAKADREAHWRRDYKSPDAYAASLSPNRDRFRRYIGAIDRRVPVVEIELTATLERSALRAETASYSVLSVRWPVLPGVHGEGLLLKPKGEPNACVVALPDADQTPEMLAGLSPGVAPESQFARRLAESGVLVVIPTLIDRRSLWSGDERTGFYTDQPHRDWIYRQAAVVGRHVIGYEVQKVQAAIDWFVSKGGPAAHGRNKIGLAGYGEGGLIALYAAAVDTRVDAACVSGYFQPRERVWEEPLYRNVWGLLTEFGDAELAAMIAPRGLVVEYSHYPSVSHPWPTNRPERGSIGQKIAATGFIRTPELASVASEWKRARQLAGDHSRKLALIEGGGGKPVAFGSENARQAFGDYLGVTIEKELELPLMATIPASTEEIDARQYRQFKELENFTQERARLAEYDRKEFFWDKVKLETPEKWRDSMQPFRDYFWDEVIGRFPRTTAPLNPRTRLLAKYSDAQVSVYEVVLDARPGILTWGYLILPASIRAGERRPVVVCQHGNGSQPSTTINLESHAYHGIARKLAERGFVVYSPYNPNQILVGEPYRQLHRKAFPLKKSVFSIYAANHERVLEWLSAQSFVDAERIAFIGHSYGGQAAARLPAMLEQYCLSISSGAWNDYVPKLTSVRSDKHTYMFTQAYETVDFDMANRFNYAEMAAMIVPRPFMVEHGYKDLVAPLEWAAAEYAKVERLYRYLGIPERTEIDFFDGGHEFDLEKTFDFLHRHLLWPRPGASASDSINKTDGDKRTGGREDKNANMRGAAWRGEKKSELAKLPSSMFLP